MDVNFPDEFIDSVRKQFAYYKSLADKTFAQLNDEQLFWQYNAESNSIATIAKHMSGNMLSRWTDFLTTDGEKDFRDREKEFANTPASRQLMLQEWEAGWKCLFDALGTITAVNFSTIVYIRNQGHTVMEAINRQLAHYPYHIGQIIFIGKMALNDQWTSLSIPRGASESYNREKFSKEKKRQHFTDEYIDDGNTKHPQT